MYLTPHEEAMLAGEYGTVKAYAMSVLTKYGDAMLAENMVPISSAHTSFTSYRHMGDVGVEWLTQLVDMGAHIELPTTTQVTCVDLTRWQELDIEPQRYHKQREICDQHLALGNIGTFTCSPYLLGNCPLKGTHVASVESSCIPYLNSIFGARTNRECGQSVLLAAIAGRTPNAGLHLDHNRKGNLLVKVEVELKNECDFGVLGYFTGKIAGTRRTPAIPNAFE